MLRVAYNNMIMNTRYLEAFAITKYGRLNARAIFFYAGGFISDNFPFSFCVCVCLYLLYFIVLLRKKKILAHTVKYDNMLLI